MALHTRGSLLYVPYRYSANRPVGVQHCRTPTWRDRSVAFQTEPCSGAACCASPASQSLPPSCSPFGARAS